MQMLADSRARNQTPPFALPHSPLNSQCLKALIPFCVLSAVRELLSVHDTAAQALRRVLSLQAQIAWLRRFVLCATGFSPLFEFAMVRLVRITVRHGNWIGAVPALSYELTLIQR